MVKEVNDLGYYFLAGWSSDMPYFAKSAQKRLDMGLPAVKGCIPREKACGSIRLDSVDIGI